MPQIDQLADGGALRAGDDIPIERAAGTRKAHGFPTDPPGVSDTGTDTYAGNFGRDVNDEEIVAGMVDSANTTTTPTLENTGGTPTGGKTITMIDGSALWAGALQNAVHIFQYDSGTDTWLLINPHLSGNQQVSQAWVDFNGGGTVSIRDNFNVSSITDDGTGDYKANFSTNLADANFAALVTSSGAEQRTDAISTSSVSMLTTNSSGTQQDHTIVSLAVFGGN